MDEHDQTPQLGSYMDGLPHPKAIPGWVWFRDFDWPALYERLGEAEPRDAAADVRQVQADYLREILVWLVAPRTTRRVGLRALMLAWTLGRKDLLTSQQLRVLRNTRWKAKKKARAAKTP
jgi:hypothetical protein